MIAFRVVCCLLWTTLASRHTCSCSRAAALCDGDKKPVTFADTCLVFFDLETNGLHADCDVLQVAMKSGDFSFATYVTPRQPIPARVTAVNRLRRGRGTDLLYGWNRVPTETPAAAVRKILRFLRSLGRPCVLVAHNCGFDAPRLVRMIQRASSAETREEFREVLRGFADTLPAFRQKFPERQRGRRAKCSLAALALETLEPPLNVAHDAVGDVQVLETLCSRHLDLERLVRLNTTTLTGEIEKIAKADARKKRLTEQRIRSSPSRGRSI